MSDPQEAEAFLDDLSRQYENGGRDYFLIVDDEKDDAIGTIGFIYPYAKHHRIADLGYGIAKAYWGTGAFQAACRQVLKYGFEELGLARIQVTTRSDNVRAVAAVEKLGFRRETVLHSFYETEDGRQDGVLLYLLADQF